MINELDLKELKTSLENLDKTTFLEEIEIVVPFENYINDSKNAPEIIKLECQKNINLAVLICNFFVPKRTGCGVWKLLFSISYLSNILQVM